MRSDALLAFVPIGGNLSLVAGAGVNVPSTNVIDLLGAGVGVAPPNIIGNATTFGENPGVGKIKQEILVNLSQAAADAPAGAGATLNIALQGAPDAGAAGNYQPGTWQTIAETSAITLAQLQTAASGAKQQPLRLDWPPNFPDNLNPRFFRLLFQMAAASPFTAGRIASALIVPCRDDYSVKQQARNYTVS